MPPRAWKILSAVAAILVSGPAAALNHAELEALVNGPWHHVPSPASRTQQENDEAGCRFAAGQTQVDTPPPAVVEIVRWSAQVNCMQALGYRPGKIGIGAKDQSTISKLPGLQYSFYPCSTVTQLRKDALNEAIFLIWARGFVEGWNGNARDDEIFKVDADALPMEQQKKFLWAFCDKNPSKVYLAAVMDLVVKLKKAALGQRL